MAKHTPVDISVPGTFSNDETITVCAIHAGTGDLVAEGQLLFELDFSKAIVEVESPADGYLCLCCSVDDELHIGDRIAQIYDTQHQIPVNAPESPSDAGNRAATGPQPVFSHAARAMLQKHGLSPQTFAHISMVREEDVVAYLERRDIPSQSKCVEEVMLGQRIPSEQPPSEKSVEARCLLQGQNRITSCFSTRINLDNLLVTEQPNSSFMTNLRNRLTPLILRETCRLLPRHNELNATYSENGIRLHHTVAIGYALDLGSGLKIVNLGDLHREALDSISESILQGVRKYMSGKLGHADLLGATFTVSDMSAENVYHFTPLVPMNQSAILGICSISKEERAMLLCLTFDHRVANGRIAARFLNDLKQSIETALSKPE